MLQILVFLIVSARYCTLKHSCTTRLAVSDTPRVSSRFSEGLTRFATRGHGCHVSHMVCHMDCPKIFACRVVTGIK